MAYKSSKCVVQQQNFHLNKIESKVYAGRSTS